MSKVFRCEDCQGLTPDPYIIYGRTLCELCADVEAPAIVAQRRKPVKEWRPRYKGMDSGYRH